MCLIGVCWAWTVPVIATPASPAVAATSTTIARARSRVRGWNLPARAFRSLPGSLLVVRRTRRAGEFAASVTRRVLLSCRRPADGGLGGRAIKGTSAISPGAGVQGDRVEASRLRCGDQGHTRRTGVQDQRGQRRLREVEVADQVAQDMGAFANVRTRVTAPVGAGIEPGSAQEV